MLINNIECAEKKINKDASWVEVKTKVLISREIKGVYYMLGKRYNPEKDTHEYYIVTTNKKIAGYDLKQLKRDNYGRVKISLFSIWNNTSLSSLSKDTNIKIQHKDSDEDSDMYLLDV